MPYELYHTLCVAALVLFFCTFHTLCLLLPLYLQKKKAGLLNPDKSFTQNLWESIDPGKVT